MTCETCNFNCVESCKFFNNEYTTNLLCIFKLPNEMIHYITQYLYHYNGHKVLYSNQCKHLCTSCFQLGFYKIIHSKKIITDNTIIYYFDSWIDDYYSKEVKTFCRKKNIPSKLDIIVYYNLKN